MKNTKKALALLLAIVMVVGLVACASKEEASAPAEAPEPKETAAAEDVAEKGVSQAEEGETLNYKKNIVLAHHQSNEVVCPQDAASGMQEMMALMQFNRLVSFDTADQELKPMLAESYKSEEGGKIWTFNLKQGVLFQNGEEMTADDVLYTYERAMEKGVVTAGWADPIDKIEAVDDYTVKMTLKNGNQDYAFQLGDASASILNREACEADPEMGCAIGTGGWKIKEFVANDYTVYERFDDSFVWEGIGLNPTETITIKYMADDNARMIGVQSGEIDIGFIANNAEFYNYQEMEGVEPVLFALWSCDYVGMNANCEYFQDENVRKAIAYAINKDEALEIINNGLGLTAKSYWCPDALGYTENFEENYTYDLEKAREYMAKSAYPDGFTVRLTTIGAYSLYAETVQAQLAQIGINCEVDLTDSPGMNEQGRAGEHELFIWNNTMQAYSDRMVNYITTDAAKNFAKISNETINQLMIDAAAEEDPAVRAELYQQVQEELNSECYIVPMFYAYLSNLVRDNVEGYVFSNSGDYLYNVRAVVE